MRLVARLAMAALGLAFLAFLVGIISNIIEVKPQELHPQHRLPLYPAPGSSSDNLFWFLQITDMHISAFQDPTRVSDLRKFCNQTLDIIKPSVVLASGDLTDARRDKVKIFDSRQLVEEWKSYKSVMDECKVNEKTLWLDVRGNHDNFNVPGVNSPENYFRNFSVQGSKHLRSYMAQVKHQQGTYSFIALDACPEPGPMRFFNFEGYVDAAEFEQLQKFGQRAANEGKHTIWFGHYPTSFITSHSDLRALIGHTGTAYLSGHLHQMLGLVPKMYSIQDSGYLELELADWKDKRLYRLLAFDHGYFSFIDVIHEEWPVVLPTNPKHALYMVPTKESLDNMRNSTHIRILAFSTAPITSVMVAVDDDDWSACDHVEGPLYVCKWNPSRFLSGIHHLKVEVRDKLDQSNTVTQPFALDGTHLSFGVRSRLILRCDARSTARGIFFILIAISVTPLITVIFADVLLKWKNKKIPRYIVESRLLRKIWILSTVHRISLPLIGYALYFAFCPLMIGEPIDNHSATIYAWGMSFKGTDLPEFLIYFYSWFHIICYQISLTLMLSTNVEERYQQLKKSQTDNLPSLQPSLSRKITFYIGIIFLQICFAVFFGLACGMMAFVFGVCFWSAIILAVYLWHQSLNLPQDVLREASFVFTQRERVANEDK